MKMSDMGTMGLRIRVTQAKPGRKRALILNTAIKILKKRGYGEKAIARFRKNINL